MDALFLREDIARAWAGQDPFDAAFALRGEIARDVAQRQTLRTDIGERSFYIKRHYGVGWPEIFKNLITGKRPVLGAENEYKAVRALENAGVDTLPIAAFGVRGRSPATQRSFLLTDDLTPSVSLESYCLSWPENPPRPTDKRVLIERVAGVARKMHASGINHRDFYICHFLLVGQPTVDAPLHLIDLHRAQQRAEVPERWLVKDLAGLYFSALDIGLTRRDVLRFLRTYFAQPLAEILSEHEALLESVGRRARALYQKEYARRNLPRQVAGLPASPTAS